MTAELRPITEQDRLDAVENLTATFARFPAELALLVALDEHRPNWDDSKNLGYYRTFVECSCGVGFWFGEHQGDPNFQDRWDAHRAQVLAAAASSVGVGKETT